MQLVRNLRLAGAALIVAIASISIGAGNEVKQAETELKAAIADKNMDALDKTLSTVVHSGGADGAKMIIALAQKIPPGDDMLYWRLLNGAASFQDDAGLGAIADAVLSSSGGTLGRDLMFAMQNNRSLKAPSAVHGKVLEKGADDLKLMAADQLGLVETVDAVDILIAAYKREEKRDGDVRKRILTSLKSLTGADCGPAAAWESWWAGARKDGPQGRSKRESTASSGTGTVVDSRPETEGLDKLTADKILVLTADCKKNKNGSEACNFDHIEKLLDQMKIPHTVASIEDFNDGKVALEGRIALILNCVNVNDHCVCPTCKPSGGSTTNRMTTCTGCDKHDLVNHRLSGSGMKVDPSTGETKKSGAIGGSVKRIKDWTERGGYLFSEDYGIWNELALAWPDLVKAGKSIKKRDVKCSPARGHTTHPMLRGVFVDSNAHVAQPEPAAAPGEAGASDGGDAGGDKTSMRDPVVPGNVVRTWVIDDDSPLIDVVNPAAVTLLMTSEELKKDGGANGDAVALTFMPSSPASEKFAAEGHPEKLVGGRVMHILSHFGKQNDSTDEFALQNLMLNFLMEGARRFPKGVK